MSAPDREKALALALAQIEKNHGKGSVMRLGDDTRPPIGVIPTGSIALDVALGVGGLPRGRVSASRRRGQLPDVTHPLSEHTAPANQLVELSCLKIFHAKAAANKTDFIHGFCLKSVYEIRVNPWPAFA